MTSSFGRFFSRATIFFASSNGHAFDCSASARREAAVATSVKDMSFSGPDTKNRVPARVKRSDFASRTD